MAREDVFLFQLYSISMYSKYLQFFCRLNCFKFSAIHTFNGREKAFRYCIGPTVAFPAQASCNVFASTWQLNCSSLFPMERSYFYLIDYCLCIPA
jgi:hypothetical protein